MTKIIVRDERTSFIEGLKATVARHKKIEAEVENGLSYLREHHADMPVQDRVNALSWLMHHVRAGNIGQDELNRFLKGDNGKPDDYPDDNDDDP